MDTPDEVSFFSDTPLIDPMEEVYREHRARRQAKSPAQWLGFSMTWCRLQDSNPPPDDYKSLTVHHSRAHYLTKTAP